MDFPILSLNELDMPEDVIIDYSSLIRSNNNIITQDDIDFMTPILLEMSRILSRYR
jgi:hypothetical protein